MNKRALIGIAVIFMIAMVSIGAVLSYRGQANDKSTCSNNGVCDGTCDGNCDGNCNQSNCTGDCTNRDTQKQQIRRCSGTCRR